ncbi:hypothetical protein [Streptacidiphilus melanogenes]|uniref:hypothetical protein n=1 Tax=Streptacidiphilus melanogenes TaxID=411235 RepID=UPI0005AA2BA0|nr:hypothetical protein [Streptacidiphilus melanogenes]
MPSATLTIDVSGLTGVADVVWPSACTHTGTVGTCTITHVWTLGDPGQPVYLGLGLKAAPSAKDGASGTVDLKATAPGLSSYEVPQTISVGSGPDLTVQQLPELNHVKVGSTVTAPIHWSNTGNETAPSTVITLSTMAGLDFQQHFSNCKYGKPTGSLNNVTAVCTINTPLAPGHALRLAQDIKLSVTRQAWYALMSVDVMPPGAQANAALAHLSDATPGTGPELTAVDATTATTGTHAKVVDINPNDAYTELDIHADNTAHYSAVGGSANGAQGKTVPVTVGMRNNGPAAIFDRSGGEATDSLRVDFPAGTTVTTVPNGCEVDTRRHGVAGHGPYECNASYAQMPGYQVLYTFRVHLDTKLTDARGTAALTNMAADMTGKPATFPWDNSTAGYVAPIVFNGPAQQTSPSATPSATASPSTGSGGTGGTGGASGTGGSGGGLAHTGGGALAVPLSLGGAAAVGLGSAVVMITRRRARAQHI